MRHVLFAALILGTSWLAVEAVDTTLGLMSADRSFDVAVNANPVADALLWVRSR